MSLANKTAMMSVGNRGWGPGSTSQRATVMRAGMRGDPGIFGDIWSGIKSVGGAVIGGATGLLTGGPLGAVGGALKGSDIIKGPTAPSLPGLGTLPISTTAGGLTLPGFIQQKPTGVSVGGLLPGGAKPYVGLDYGGGQNGATMKPPGGYHWNKTDYFLRDGTFVAAGTKLVKNRRRNPANSRATNRAISRVAQAKRHAKDLSRITIRKKESCR